jgi:hypothetical protein
LRRADRARESLPGGTFCGKPGVHFALQTF